MAQNHKKPIMGYGNRIDEATLSGGSWLEELPLQNLQSRMLSQVTRSSDVQNTSTWFDIQLPKERLIGLVALVRNNISVYAKIRITGFVRDEQRYQSNWQAAWGITIPYDLLEWEDDSYWTGVQTQELRETTNAAVLFIERQKFVVDRIRIEIDDTRNPHGYIDIGRVFISDFWAIKNGIDFGHSLGYEDPSQIERSLGGSLFFNEKQQYRSYSFTIKYVYFDEAYESALEIMRVSGLTKEVLLIPDPSDNQNMQRRAFVGRISQPSRLVQPFYGGFQASFEIEELI